MVGQIEVQATLGQVGSVSVFTQMVVENSEKVVRRSRRRLVQGKCLLELLQLMHGKGEASAAFNMGEVVTFNNACVQFTAERAANN